MEDICNHEGLKLTPDGIEAVFKLCAGDMRRVVNMLQVTQYITQSLSMMEGVVELDAKAVYDFTGSPSPAFLDKTMDILLNEAIDQSFRNINASLKEMGIALETILKSIYLRVLESRMPPEQQAFLVNRLGDIEYRLSIGCQESLALSSLVGAFSEVRFIAAQ
jgi:replication factor C subunit 3/5